MYERLSLNSNPIKISDASMDQYKHTQVYQLTILSRHIKYFFVFWKQIFVDFEGQLNFHACSKIS
jgi:hypothetical protein